MRNNNLDILKIVLAFLVVALHIFPVAKMEGIVGLISYEIASGITRIAVPTFFLISGYFLRNKIEDKVYLWKYARRILLLYVVWQLIYLPDLIRFYNLKRFSSFDAVLKVVYGYWHLWYLLASVLAVGLLYVSRNLTLKLKSVVIVLFLSIGYGYQMAYQSNFVHDLNGQFLYEIIGTTRNFLFFAFPMLLLGTLYENWKDSVAKIKHFYFPLWLVLLVEVYFYYQFKVKAMDFLLVLPVLSMLTFSIVNEARSISERKINTTFSLGIYLVHPYAIRLVYEFLPQKTFGFVVFKYLLICLIAICFWWILDKINKKLPYFF
ncbi:acyltransferase [Flavobacterium amnicola]|uniref:Acyltransferase n=1 Tax=Flavobacterium amnicola TaxID=2506422 RepID=A0A4Q1K0P7_9FLAO|nr:acyltransferase family protein [Flavobacterium amnicola]RXR17712.1 acyltransferase [Flavobacterium amnicola]